MRNIRNTKFDNWKSPDGRYITAVAWDVTSDSALCTLGPNESDTMIELVRINLKARPPFHKSIAFWDAPCPNSDSVCEDIINLHYFADTSTACLVMAGGDVIVVREIPIAGEEKIEIIGSVDEGITAAKWSPDEELLIITSKADTVIYMSRGFEGIIHVSMTSDDLNVSKQISVGWGKKETQFKGRGARAMVDPTMPEKVDEGALSTNDDSTVSISWRGDGLYLAISSVVANRRRAIRVYSREGILDSISEPVDGLEGTLSWRPSGNLIAAVQRLEDHLDIVFFERNGLRHGQFSLRMTAAQFKNSCQKIKLNWSPDSSVLAVTTEEHTELWTMGNYHWYLKQQVSHECPLPIYSLLWHPEKVLKFILGSKDYVTIVENILTTVQTSSAPHQNYGVVAVVDGKIVKLTPFLIANIPPPMSLHEIEIASNVTDVSINNNTCSIAVLHQIGISIFDWTDIASASSGPELTKDINFTQNTTQNFRYQQISWSGNDEIATLHSSDSVSQITRFSIDREYKEIEIKKLPYIFPNQSFLDISTLSSYCKGGFTNAFFQSCDGTTQNIHFEERSLFQRKLPLNLPWVEMVSCEDEIFAVGMSNHGYLYANDHLLAKNCSSFIVTPLHLIFTTSSHFLKFVYLTKVENLEIPPDNVENDERCRSVERGARIVTAIPKALSLVLQMPRGNLETIYPRAMVLAGIRSLVLEKNYKKAFTSSRTHRVDMNLLYDYAPAQFLSNLELFVRQLKKSTYIDLFLSSLREEDVTKTIYKEVKDASIYDDNITPEKSNVGIDLAGINQELSKINKICDGFLNVFNTFGVDGYFQNMITAYVCKSPPALEDGLLIVARLIKDSQNLAEKAAEHICFLADVNKLYDNALGLYDLDLALLIVQQSQKDPREYLPFFQDLQKMSTLRRQFSIDDYLKRHTSALKWLHSLNSIDELKAYTKKHSLYSAALSLYRYDAINHSTIMHLYADHLESKSEYSSAALAYESLSNFPKAKSCYLSSGSKYWRQTLYCALSQSPPVSGTALTDLASSLYDALLHSKDYYSAATIQLEYLSSVSTACHALCKGYFFAEAFQLIALKRLPELLTTTLEPGLIEAFSSSTELLADCRAQLLAQVPRIRELRIKALTDPLAFYEGERVGADANIPDDVSIVASSHLTTNNSLFTRYTGKDRGASTVGTIVSRATSKHRKKEERKRASGKKGSVYEQEYLVNSVERLIRHFERSREEIDRLIEGLVRRGMWDRARAMQDALANMIKMCAAIIPEVFNVESRSAEADKNQHGQPTGTATLQLSLEAISKRKDLPTVAPLKEISLLA